MNIPRKAVPVYLATIAYAVLIFYLSSEESTSDTAFSSILDIEHVDKLTHVAEYAILGILLFLSFHFPPHSNVWLQKHLKTELHRLSFFPFLVGSLYALSDEIHQAYVPGRDASPFDFIADVVGVILGILIMIRIIDIRKQKKRRDA